MALQRLYNCLNREIQELNADIRKIQKKIHYKKNSRIRKYLPKFLRREGLEYTDFEETIRSKQRMISELQETMVHVEVSLEIEKNIDLFHNDNSNNDDERDGNQIIQEILRGMQIHSTANMDETELTDNELLQDILRGIPVIFWS